LLARFAAGAANPRGTVAAVLAGLGKTAEDAAAAASRGDAEGLLAGVRRSARLLERLGAEADMPIVTPALRRLVDTAERAGAAAKPSGAGAGDCGIALATSARQAADVCRAWRQEGIEPLEVGIAPEGVSRA
jgi:phosphomevalonate kinase